MIKVVFVLVVQGFLINAFPSGQDERNDGDTKSFDIVALKPEMEGIAECNETTTTATSPGNLASTQEVISESPAIISETNKSSQNNSTELVIDELVLEDSVLAEKGEEINQTYKIVDKLVDSKLEKVDKIMTRPSFKNENLTGDIDSAIPDLMQLKLKMASEWFNIKDSIKTELEKARKQIKSVVLESKAVAESVNATKLSTNAAVLLEKETKPNMIETEYFLEPESDDFNLSMQSKSKPLQIEEIEAKLAKINDVVEAEVAMINLFVESELALTEALIRSEVDKVNTFVESKFNSADLVEPEMTEESIEGTAKFNGIVPASRRDLIFGSTAGCAQEVISESPAIISETNESKQNNSTELVIDELVLEDSVLAEKGEEINQTYKVVDKLVDSKLEKVDKIMTQPSFKNENLTGDIGSAIPDLMQLELKMASEWFNIKDSIKTELEKARKQIRSVVLESKAVAESVNATKSSTNTAVLLENETKPNMIKTESFLESESDDCNLSMQIKSKPLQIEEVEAKLAKINDVVEAEVAMINLFVESELALTEALIRSEVDKVNTFVESKFNSPDLVEPEMTEELIEVPIEGTAEFSGIAPALGRALIFESTGYTPILPVLEGKADTEEAVTLRAAAPVVDEVFTGTVPVFGRTLVFGSTGFLRPNLAPLENTPKKNEECPNAVPILVDSIPIDTEYDPLFPFNPSVIDNVEPPSESKKFHEYNTGKNDFLLEKNKELNIPDRDDLVPRTNKLTREHTENKHKVEVAVVEGRAEFSGTARSAGRTRLVAGFGCRPLMPTAETSDGKKYLWIAKRPTINAPPPVSRKPETTNRAEFPRYFPGVSKFSPDFPETVIMDSTKNYERLIEYEALGEGDAPVVGEVLFEGKTPAFGSVRITGHCG